MNILPFLPGRPHSYALNDLTHSPTNIAPETRINTMLTFTSNAVDSDAIAPARSAMAADIMRTLLLVIISSVCRSPIHMGEDELN